MRYIEGGLLFFEKNRLHYQFAELPDLHSFDPAIYEKKYLHHNFNVEFVGSNSNINIEKTGPSSFHHSYLIGNDRSKWGKKAKDFERLTYKELYTGIDLEYYLQEGNVKFDFLISPGASTDQIKFKYDGDVDLSLEEGQLRIQHQLGEISILEPYAYQIINGVKKEIDCQFKLRNHTVSYELPNGYDENIPLIIDPAVIYFTYTGTLQSNFGMTATDDSLGNGYTGGTVFGSGYATTTGAYNVSFSGGTVDIAISKFSPDARSLLYGTYIGGNQIETIHSMVVDGSNDSLNLYFLGATSSSNYPTSLGAYDNSYAGSSSLITETNYSFSNGADIVVSKLDSSGSILLGSTFYGGNAIDGLNFPKSRGVYVYDSLLYNYGDSHRGEIIIDRSGNCLIATSTRSLSLSGSINNLAGRQDGLIVKFSNNLRNLVWSRYLGGSQDDAIYSIKILDNNKVLVGGGTVSHTNFPTSAGSINPTSSNGRSEGFISVISADGQTVENSTFLGTSSYDQVFFIEYDRFQNIYALGQTTSGNFPLKKVDNVPNFEADTGAGQFIVKLTRNLDSAIFSMTFGDGGGTGTPNISPTAFLVDRCQNVFAAGWGGTLVGGEGAKVLTDSMPITPDAFDKLTDNQDFYFYVLNRDADRVFYATYFGNNNRDHVDGGTSRFDKDGVVYQSLCADCGGFRSNYAPNQSQVFAPTNRVLPSIANKCSNALLKFDMSLAPNAGFSVSATERCLAPGDTIQIRVKDNSYRADQYAWDFFGNTFNGPLPGGDSILVISTPGTYTIYQVITDTICLLDDSSRVTIVIRPDDIALAPSKDSIVCFTDSIVLTAGASPTANFYLWSRSPQFTDTISEMETFKHGLRVGVDTLYLKVGNNFTNACEKYDTVYIDYFPILYSPIIDKDTICENTSVQLAVALQNIDRFVWDFDNGSKDSTNRTPTIFYGSPGDYNISLLVENFVCNAKDTTYLPLNVYNNDILLTSIPDTLVCRQDSVVFDQTATGTNIIQYLWSSDSLFSDTLNNYPLDGKIQIQQGGIDTFYVKVSNAFCSQTDQLKVELIPFHLELDNVIDSVCTPFSQQLSTTIIGTDSFRIYLGNGSSTNVDKTPTISFTTGGLYNIQLMGYNNRCQIADTLIEPIRVFPGIELNYQQDTVICFGETTPLKIKHNQTGAAFIWSVNSDLSAPLNNPQDSIILVSPSSPTVYYYQAINGICKADSSFSLDVDNVEILLPDYNGVCLEDTLEIDSEVISNYPPFTYTWSPVSDIIGPSNAGVIYVSPPSDRRYKLTVTDNIQCFDTASSLVEVNMPRFTTANILSPVDTIYKGQSMQLRTNRNEVGLTYQWSPPEFFDDPFSANPKGTFPESTTVTVTITDDQTGCIVVSQKRIGVFEINCSIPDIFIPTAFTPNGDGNNDVVFVRGLVIDKVELSIYNRWGEKVFETTSTTNGWDGTYKGKAADPGVFVYHLKVECFDGQKFTDKGNITLIR